MVFLTADPGFAQTGGCGQPDTVLCGQAVTTIELPSVIAARKQAIIAEELMISNLIETGAKDCATAMRMAQEHKRADLMRSMRVCIR